MQIPYDPIYYCQSVILWESYAFLSVLYVLLISFAFYI